MARVHLDFGHGGRDPGAVGNGLQEKDIVLVVGLKVRKILEGHNIEVTYSRTTDVFVELNERANMANKVDADIFVSLHINSATNASARGVETFSYISSVKGVALATDIQNNVVNSNIFTANRGIKSANFAVLRLTKMPSVLVELGFISNIEDSQILRTKQDEIAIAVAKGILKNLGIKYIENTAVEEKGSLIKINLHGKDLEVEGIFKDTTNYIPVRFLEQLGYEVGWKNNKVTIDYKGENK